MKPAPFTYHRPTSPAEAVDLAADLEDAEYMAGNQSLGIVMANRLATPDHVIDLTRLDDLAYVDVTDDLVEVGALTTHRTIERAESLHRAVPMLPEAAEQIAGPSVRNRGTLGGSIGEADPAGNYPTALVALDGDITLRDVDGTRTVPARDFFIAYMFTDRAPHELIESVTIPRDPFPTDRTGMAFTELKRASQTWPTVSAAAAVRVDDPESPTPVVEDARMALANADDVPLHVPEAVAAVEDGTLGEDDLDAAGAAVRDAANPSEEMHADGEFKLETAAEYAQRALEAAYDRAQGGPAIEGGESKSDRSESTTEGSA